MIQPIMKQFSASKKSEKLADLCNLDFTRLHGKKILNFYVKDMIELVFIQTTGKSIFKLFARVSLSICK